MTTLALTLIGLIEALVHLWRYRTANSDAALSSACAAMAVQSLRVLGIFGAVATLGAGDVVPAVGLIVGSGVGTLVAHVAIKWRRDMERLTTPPTEATD